MTDFWKADFFFFITTGAIILGSLISVTVAIYLVLILRDVRALLARLRDETDLVATDLAEARARVREEGWLAILLGQWTKFQRREKVNNTPSYHQKKSR